MPVYMIRAGENGPVKLGHTTDIAKRLCELQVAHWETLRILRLFEGGEAEEAKLHSHFNDLWIRGEWHHFSRAMLYDVGLTEIVRSVTMAPTVITGKTAFEMGQQIAALRLAKGLTQSEAADRICISRSHLASIEAGHDFPGRVTLMSICTLFGVPFAELAA